MSATKEAIIDKIYLTCNYLIAARKLAEILEDNRDAIEKEAVKRRLSQLDALIKEYYERGYTNGDYR